MAFLAPHRELPLHLRDQEILRHHEAFEIEVPGHEPWRLSASHGEPERDARVARVGGPRVVPDITARGVVENARHTPFAVRVGLGRETL